MVSLSVIERSVRALESKAESVCKRCGKPVKVCYDLCYRCESNRLVQEAIWYRLPKGKVKPESSPTPSSPVSP